MTGSPRNVRAGFILSAAGGAGWGRAAGTEGHRSTQR